MIPRRQSRAEERGGSRPSKSSMTKIVDRGPPGTRRLSELPHPSGDPSAHFRRARGRVRWINGGAGHASGDAPVGRDARDRDRSGIASPTRPAAPRLRARRTDRGSPEGTHSDRPTHEIHGPVEPRDDPSARARPARAREVGEMEASAGPHTADEDPLAAREPRARRSSSASVGDDVVVARGERRGLDAGFDARDP